MAWVFRTNDPMIDRLRENESDLWPVEQHHTLVNPGDVVLFWEGGTTGQLVGGGKILTQLLRSSSDFRKHEVRVSHSIVLERPITANELAGDPVLSAMPVLQRADRANYGLSKSQMNRLLGIMADRQDGIEKALNLRKGTIKPIADMPVAADLPSTAPAEERTPFTRKLLQRAEAFHNDPVVARIVTLRELARDELRSQLNPNVLAEISVEGFEDTIARFGSVTINGNDLSLQDALGKLSTSTPDDIRLMAAEGTLNVHGNLTWTTNLWSLSHAVGKSRLEETGGLSLRLRAALAHLLSEDLRIDNRIDRMRRSMEALWPHIATGILMVLSPDEHIVFHGASVKGAAKVFGLKKQIKTSIDGYNRYLAYAREVAKNLHLAWPYEVDLFLVQESTPDWLESTTVSERRGPVTPDTDTDTDTDEKPPWSDDPPARDVRRDVPPAPMQALPDPEPEATPNEPQMDEELPITPPVPDDVVSQPEASEPVSVEQPSIQAELPVENETQWNGDANEGQAVFALYQHLRSNGVIIALDQLIDVYLSLKTVPMIVMGGPAGVGKHFVLREMADGMGARHHSVPVSSELGPGPSAEDAVRLRDLLGKIDPRTGLYRPESWFEAMLDAHEHPDEAVFLCVNTISEWREDYWFSEYVRLRDSRIPSRSGGTEVCPVTIVPGVAKLKTEDGRTLPASFPLPDNLFLVMTTIPGVIPTMLVSERVNFIELEPADLSLGALRPGHPSEGGAPATLGSILVKERRYRSIRDVIDRPWIKEWNDEIEQISSLLSKGRGAVGYRLRDEILSYLAYADDLNDMLPYGASFPLETAFDYQLSQRVLPLYFGDEQVPDTISRVLMYAQGSGGAERFPRTAARLTMLEQGMDGIE